MAHASAQAIEFPNDQRVAGPQVLKRFVQSWAIRFGTRYAIFEYLAATGRLERIDLWVQRLIGR